MPEEEYRKKFKSAKAVLLEAYEARDEEIQLLRKYEDTRIRYLLLSFSCTLLVTEEPGSAIAAHSLVLLDPRRLVGQCKYLPF